MTKRIALIAAIFAMFMLCAACGTQTEETTLPTPTETTSVPTEQTSTPITEPTTQPAEPTHVHRMGVEGIRNIDYAEHHYRCDCGEIITEPHAFDEEGTCTVCAGRVRREENGEYVLTTLHDKVGFTSADWFYKPIEPGSDTFYHYLTIDYYSDGVKEVIEYGTDGYITTHTCYSADGSIAYVETRTYEFDAYGGYELDIFWNGELSEERTYMLMDDGSLDSIFFIRYDWSLKDGEWVDDIRASDYELDESGRVIYFCDYLRDILRYEAFFEYDAKGDRHKTREIRYDANGRIIADQSYDSNGTTTGMPHAHQMDASDPWSLDYKEHVYQCVCREEVSAPHRLDETGYCSVCDASIRTDENGEYIVTITYETGMTSAIEKFYKPVESGSDEFYHYRSFYYDRDGYWNWIEYGTHGHITSHTYYTPDGTVTMVETRSYRFFEDGGYELDIFEDGELVEERTYMLRDDGSLDQIFYIRYGWSLEDGEWVDWITVEEYELDEAGNLIFFRDYDDGNLRFEAFFAYDEAGNHYQKQVIRYDQNGQIMYQLYFDPAGNQINP